MKDIDYKEITLLGGAKVQVDFSQRPTPCRKCAKPIRFGITAAGKYMPVIEVDGQWQSHFADCEFAKDFRKTKMNEKLDQMDKERAKFSEDEDQGRENFNINEE